MTPAARARQSSRRGAGEAGAVGRDERAFAQLGAEVAGVGVGHHRTTDPVRSARTDRPSSSRRNCSGPATSTMPFVGAPTATSATAAATSSAAIGWMSTGGEAHGVAVRGGVDDALEELEELGGVHDRVRESGRDDQLLLGDLRPHVPAVRDAVAPRRWRARRGGPRRRPPPRRGGCGSTSRRTPARRRPRTTASSTRRRRPSAPVSASATPSPVRVFTPGLRRRRHRLVALLRRGCPRAWSR